jgi:tetratricopeptide (TPR) repeat protein
VWTPHRVGLRICVYAISKNEAHFVPRFCESAKEADMILIADTGSTDGLPEVARVHGAVVHDICITPWRFDLARNAALALIPRDMDVCISLDIDEVLQPGWREEIERVWKKGETTRLRYMFDWGAGIAFYYEKIHARHGYFWHHPCHEYPVPDGRITEVWAQTDMLLAVHLPDPTKSRGQYMDLLELSVKEDPRCPRNAFYYARELSFNQRWQESIDALNRYLAMPEATWNNERCYAYRTMGRCYSELGNLWEAEKAFHQACGEAPNTREPWCELAMLTYRQNRWEETFAYAMRALKITDRAAVYTCDPAVWGHWPHDLASIAAWQLGLKDIALEQAELAAQASPDDLRLEGNLMYIRAAMSERAAEAA